MIGLPAVVSRALAGAQLDWIRDQRPFPVPGCRMAVRENVLELEIPDVGHAAVRIARNPYPFTEVWIDGARSSWRAGPLGGIVLDLTPGGHHVVIVGTERRARRWARFAQIGIALTLIALIVTDRARRA